MALGSVHSGGNCNRYISRHNEDDTAHADIRRELAELRTELKQLKLQMTTDVTKNSFSTSFKSLEGTTVTGVWNAEQARIEF